MGWHAFDFDGVLAKYEGWNRLGPPIQGEAFQLLAQRLREGKECRIFTARVSTRARNGDTRAVDSQRAMIKAWCVTYLGADLEVTCEKDGSCEAIYDDRAHRVEKDTGRVL